MALTLLHLLIMRCISLKGAGKPQDLEEPS